ncbi:nitrite reductase small subunit NirD [Streptomyces collinus]|uniref:Nitrite reductase small subunit n=1 Tax=Streptomyces collinus (strain DSM 40733 / Tue 365) TaxID=1214242 RepID=S5VLY8_STRC3|nr:nitrite reductase small subunit NirD [Streptomyces collinus]AGS69375.1 nitrite reductase small subunit [Streptomyces collinus Tu 365]UJA08017.1 nitrite reductase small subunit NirD [Streptomyces collinus]UJA17118.1 nitrite reductase small subunit NirD [Streptomyces collinus]
MTLAPETTGLKVQLRWTEGWFTVCDLHRVAPGRGVAALLPDGGQVAVFRDRSDRLYAIGNRDPFTGAAVLSRGLTGTHRGRPFVASPLLKQRFDLQTGACLDDESVRVRTYEVRCAPAGTGT